MHILFDNNVIYSEEAREIYKIYQWGFLREAIHRIEALSDKDREIYGLDLLYYKIRKDLDKNIPYAPVTLWIVDRNTIWEREWLNEILPKTVVCSSEEAEVLINRTIIIVDNKLDFKSLAKYKRLSKSNKIVLVHLSDEAFEDDISIYRYCDIVFRNYYSPLLADQAKVFTIPLGYKAGHSLLKNENLPDKDLKWSFAGDASKHTRVEMLEALKVVRPNFIHLTGGWNHQNSLSSSDYINLMKRSWVVPCPGGFVNLESFRVYEALEFGCIPIVEKRECFNYFYNLLGENPILSLEKWSDTEEIMKIFNNIDYLNHYSKNCRFWWKNYKNNIKNNISKKIYSI